MKPIIGVDFDNTIVCYNEVFHEVALEQNLITADFPQDKEKIRNYLREQGQEDLWTEMQGYVYGKRMVTARPFQGAADFFNHALSQGIDIAIISHKTRYPYAGPRYDLHEAAKAWLETRFFPLLKRELHPSNVFFMEAKQQKIAQIAIRQCTHFIDDLPELLMDEAFPNATQRLLFAPQHTSMQHPSLQTFNSWQALQNYFFEDSL